MLNSGQNWRFFVPCDLEFQRMTLKNNRALFLCYFNLCASFRSHWWTQTVVPVRKHPIWVKNNSLSYVTLKFHGWPWKTIGHCPKQHQALCIISSSYVNSNWSYSLETAKWGYDLCDLLWPLTFAFGMDITSVIGNNSWKFHDDTMMGT